jgi:hypothetical protein
MAESVGVAALGWVEGAAVAGVEDRRCVVHGLAVSGEE